MGLQLEVEKSIDNEAKTLTLRLKIWPDGVDAKVVDPDVDESISQHIKAESQHPDSVKGANDGAKFTAQELMDEASAAITEKHKTIIQEYQSRTAKLALVDEAAIKTELEKVVV